MFDVDEWRFGSFLVTTRGCRFVLITTRVCRFDLITTRVCIFCLITTRVCMFRLITTRVCRFCLITTRVCILSEFNVFMIWTRVCIITTTQWVFWGEAIKACWLIPSVSWCVVSRGEAIKACWRDPWTLCSGRCGCMAFRVCSGSVGVWHFPCVSADAV